MVSTVKASLLRGLDWNSVEYYYQPIYNTSSRVIDKAEMLVRMQDGRGGYFDAEELVSAAEEMGYIDEMDRRAFLHACEALPEFQTHGIRQLSVNLSPAACHAARLIPEVRRILTETKTAPRDICLEITEVAKLLDEEQLFKTLKVLYDMGVRLAMDDFGKGYSNLQRLINAPFHVLKLDKSLIWGIREESKAGPLLDSIIRFAGENGISVVAEGIETKKQAQLLSQMGCDYLQGYYYGKPMPRKQLFARAEEISEKMKTLQAVSGRMI